MTLDAVTNNQFFYPLEDLYQTIQNRDRLGCRKALNSLPVAFKNKVFEYLAAEAGAGVMPAWGELHAIDSFERLNAAVDRVVKRVVLEKMPEAIRTQVYGKVCEFSPIQSDDLSWGEHHAFDDMKLLAKAISILGLFRQTQSRVKETGILDRISAFLPKEEEWRFRLEHSIQSKEWKAPATFRDEDLLLLRDLCPDLKKLDLSGCRNITDRGLAHLRGMGLISLNLAGCSSITDEGLGSLSTLTSLRSLDLFRCYRITDAGLSHLRVFTRLEFLDLAHCLPITDAGLGSIASLTGLQSLNLSCCNQITDEGLPYLRALTLLQSLNLKYCYRITDAGLGSIASLTGLQFLNLNGCSQITDEGLPYLRALTLLQSLNLKYCYRITDEGLGSIESLTGLQSLNLSCCNQITDEGLSYLRALTSLQYLNLKVCRVTDAG